MLWRAIVIAAVLCGCQDPTLEDLKRARDEVCKCKDAECGEAAMKKVPQIESKADHKMQAVASDMLNCMAKLYLKDRPTTGPDGEAPPPAPGSADPAPAKQP